MTVPALLDRLEAIRGHFGAPVRVTSGTRCPAHNDAVGGEPGSMHLIGLAADITVDGVKPAAVANWVEDTWQDKGGVGRYSTFTHVDVRLGMARWAG